MNPEKQKFTDVFDCCRGLESLCGGLSQAVVESVTINRQELTMAVTARFAKSPAPGETGILASRIAADYGLNRVTISCSNQPEQARKARAKPAARPEGSLLYGRRSRGKPVPMSELHQESGSVTVEGEVFSVDSRAIEKRGAWVLSFDITDYTGSIRVSKYIRGGDDKGRADTVKEGMTLRVSGQVSYNRYDEDISLEPRSIEKLPGESRRDDAPEKRVELHLHSRFSALDALCDPEKAVAAAARFGHPAIAVTDHGVAHAFPDFWRAGKKHQVKIIYGLEGYYINDTDAALACSGDPGLSLEGDYAAFDLETTGLSALNDRITEIGAVVMKDGRSGPRFQTFVNPGMPIPPEITRLTGITDRDVFDAPDEKTALAAFLDFLGDLPLAAHNAAFDMGFLSAAARRCGLDFDPPYLDTLGLARGLLPELKRHRLDTVARHLGLPDFRHHRASDDAVTVAHMLERFLPMLKEQGASTWGQAEELMRERLATAASPRQIRHIILLAKNKKGLKNLYKLISLSHLEHFKKHPIIPKSLLTEHREGLIVGMACESGEIFDALLSGKGWQELLRLASFYDYLEIQPLSNNDFLVQNGKVKDKEALMELNRQILALGRELGLPVCATCDAHFVEPREEIYRRVLLAGKSFQDADRDNPLYLRTTEEMLAEFAYLGAETAYEVVVTNTNRIAGQCEEMELFPKKLFTPVIENSARDLQELVLGRMRQLYGENPPEPVKARVKTELEDIIGCHYDVIYMCAQKLVASSLEAGYLVGSRGSVGSSLAAYLAGITEVNSLPPHYRCPQCKYSDFQSGSGWGCGADMPDKCCPQCGDPMEKDGFDIPFETFLGFGGSKIPDIDLNFSGEYQARAHKHTEDLFGADHVFRAGTIGTLAKKTAYGYVKKYLEERGLTVTKAEENRLVAGCVGVKRTTGQHPGGLIIIPQDMEITDFCPVQHPADSKDSGVITTHFEYHSMEDNLLKLDELGHDDPTMIKMLEDATGVDARQIPLDDPDTLTLFQSPLPLGLPEDDPIIGQTGTIGIPEFGTGFTRSMLVDTKPRGFDTLVRLSGFSHGTDVWLGNAKDLILSGTASIKETIGCRDDIMLYLISRGMNQHDAFTIMEAVRKGRGLKPEWEREMTRLGVPSWYIGSCNKIKYLFPKAHAVAYVMMAFRIAWFKVHRPLAYYSAYFYRRADSFDAQIMLEGIDKVRNSIQRLGRGQELTAKEQDSLVTLESVYEFYLRGFTFDPMDLYQSDPVYFLMGENSLRPPFTAISGLGETAAYDLVAARSLREYVSIEDLLGACSKVSQTNAEQLRALGAFGNLPETSQMSLF